MCQAPPNLLFVTSQFGVRSEVWMYRQATRMSGSKVTVLCREHRNQDIYPATEELEVVVTPQAVIVPSAVRRFGRNLPTRVFSAVTNRLQNRKFGYFPGTASERDFIIDELKRIQPRMVLFQYGTNAVRYADFFHRLGQRYAIHFHGHDLSSAVQDPSYAKQIVRAGHRAEALVVVAQYMRDWLLEHGIESEKVQLIPYGVPMEKFKPNENTTGESSIVEFLMVGRLTPKKAPELTIRAFAKCHAACDNTRLKIIGDGELLSTCTALVSELNIESAVEFLGSQPTDVVRKAMRDASIFLQHSVTAESGDKEGWPVAVAEAAGSGLPIVSTSHASIPEQVVHGESGLICEELDWDTMAANMITLAEDSTLREQFGRASRAHISQWDNQHQIDVLEKCLLAD